MNIAHIFETALFILAAFIIGAVLGYLIRCMFFRPKAATASVAATVAVAKVAPKPSPKPIASSATTAKPATTKPVASKPAVAKPAAPKATSPKPAAPKATSAKPAAPSDADGKPVGLSGPRNGKKDDLKRIKGVGTKIEDTLNGLGIYHFDQVGGWSSKTVEWVNGFISFKGRIQREKWISQAQALAEGKPTEFSKRVDKGQVPSSKK